MSDFPIYEHRNNDERVREALRRIDNVYGDVCEVLEGGDALVFGLHQDLDPADVWDQVWITEGDEVLPTDNLINALVSTSGTDTQEVQIEGLTINGGVFTRVVQTATLTGILDVILGTPLARITRLTSLGASDFTGVVTVRQSVAGTVHLTVPVGRNNSAKGATTVADDEYFLLGQFAGGQISQANGFVRHSLQTRMAGGVFVHQPMLVTHSYGPYSVVDFDPLIVVPPNSDIRIEALSTSINMEATVWLNGFVAKKVV